MQTGGTFTDDDDSIFEENIGWLASAGVTLGCNPPTNDKFCPKNNVTREQMSAFMRRFAQYLGAEDGQVSMANHADSATNASKVDGKDAIDLQPALFAADRSDTVAVTANAACTLAAADVTTSARGICIVGQTPTAYISVRGSGYTTEVDVGETATFRLIHDGAMVFETTRVVTDVDGSFAVEWLFDTGSGTEEPLVTNEANGNLYNVVDSQLTFEVLDDKHCAGTGGIIIPPSGNTTPEDGE